MKKRDYSELINHTGAGLKKWVQKLNEALTAVF